MPENDTLFSADFISSLGASDKQEVLDGLLKIIETSYQAEQEFHNLKNLYNNVLEMLPQAIWVLEINGEIYYQNNQAYNLSQLFEIIKTSIFIYGDPAKLGARKEQFESELELKGNAYLFRINYLPDKIIITAIDITAQKRQERLASMGQVSAHLAHEIRNPIGSISILTSSLLRRGDASVQGIAEEIKKSIWRVERLINATLLFSKGINIARKKVSLSAIKSELNESISYYTFSKNIDFVFDFDESREIFIDFDLFSIVLQNFVINAIDAIEESENDAGLVKIGFVGAENLEAELFSEFKLLDRLDSNACAMNSGTHKNGAFFITDNGKKITDESVLFEPFKTTKLKGNGLGLALSHQIILAHGGNVSLQNNDVEKTFRIEI